MPEHNPDPKLEEQMGLHMWNTLQFMGATIIDALAIKQTSLAISQDASITERVHSGSLAIGLTTLAAAIFVRAADRYGKLNK